MTKPTQQKKSLTKEEVIAELKQCAKKLERVPTYTELRKMTRVTVNGIRKHFGTFTRALRMAELEVGHAGVTSTMKDLFNDWAMVARAVKRVPTVNDYCMHGKYSRGRFCHGLAHGRAWRKGCANLPSAKGCIRCILI